jgi:hypothetical protein
LPVDVKAGFVGRFRSNANDRGGVVRDVTVIERELDRAFERIATMVGGVRHCIPQEETRFTVKYSVSLLIYFF